MLFQDKSNSHKLMAVAIEKLVSGSLLNMLWDMSNLSKPSSLNKLSGKLLKRLLDTSTILSLFKNLNTSFGKSASLLLEASSTYNLTFLKISSCEDWIHTCSFLVFLNISKSISYNPLWDISNHCKWGMFPKTSLVAFNNRLCPKYRWVMDISTGRKNCLDIVVMLLNDKSRTRILECKAPIPSQIEQTILNNVKHSDKLSPTFVRYDFNLVQY